jgi:hypothetical protein
VVYIDDVQKSFKGSWSHSMYVQFDEPTTFTYSSNYKEYEVTGHRTELEEPKLRFQVHHMDLMSDDKERMKLNPKDLPNPSVSNRRSDKFHLPLGPHVVYGFSPSRLLACVLTEWSFQLSKAPCEQKTTPCSR